MRSIFRRQTLAAAAAIVFLGGAARAQTVTAPADGNTYLVGQIVAVSVDSAAASWAVSGPARQASDPPNRLNGQQAWAESAGGPFIQSWAGWYYDEGGGEAVPAADVPASWNGIP